MSIKSVEIQNFKSIKDSGRIELGNINVLIGANGSGKSNFIEFFNFLKNITEEKLFIYIRRNGSLNKNGMDNILHFGRKESTHLSAKISFYDDDIEDGYIFDLNLNNDNVLVFVKEEIFCVKDGLFNNYILDSKYKDGEETSLKADLKDKRNKRILNCIELLKIYHFNDTGFTSNIKIPSAIVDNQLYLREDGSDIALFLYNFSNNYPKKFKRLEYIINSITPTFEKFHFVKHPQVDEIYLQWVENDTIFPISSLSDGTLRFICLASILMSPIKPPTIILDEPELGLHPFAIAKLAAMIRIASKDSQIILSTQSVELISEFSANDIIIVEKKENQTTFKRQSEKDLENWIDEYSVGEIWCSNIIGGNP